MLRPWLRETGDAAGAQHATELSHHLGAVGHVVKSIEAAHAIDARIGQVDVMAVEQDESRTRAIANRRQPCIQLPSKFERRWRHVKRDGVAAQ